jgi:hypothetical protein
VRVAVIDLTGKRMIKPDFAGWGSTVAIPSMSTIKAALVYAAVQIKDELRRMAQADPSFNGMDKVIGAMRKKWEHVPFPPDIGRLFAPGSAPAALMFSDQAQWAVDNIIDHDNANEAARILIDIIGFRYIASLLWQSGLRHPTRGGMWLTHKYNSTDTWEGGPRPQPGPHFANTATALSLATFFMLLGQRRLSTPAGSDEIRKALTVASWFAQQLPSATIASKVGLLRVCTKWELMMKDGKPVLGPDKKPRHKCVNWVTTIAHEAAYIENDPVRYAVAITTVDIPEGITLLKHLVADIDALVRANNP